ncbi:carbohydrate ABC transporter permease [Paenibacillus azoreducens]|uniref:carbohydrate ABC transporter permease n=1 Tax=Paenibacillus azoreducens TaxID=116718 RepID=UPI0039F518EC
MSEISVETKTSKRVRPLRADSKLKGLWTDIVRNRVSYYFLAPFMILFLVFTIIPVLTAFGLSFTYFNILEPPKWIGLSNYRLLFIDDDIFLTALGNTLKFAVVTGPVGYAMAFLLAWLISQIPQKFRFFYTLCYYTPSIASGVAMTVVWQYLFSGDRYGLLNYWLLKLGLINEPWQWLENVNTILPIIMIVSLWMSMGIGFLAFLAGLQNVPRDMYEAGAIDGVKYRWQELWYITVPAVKPQLLFGAVMQVVGALNVFSVSVELAGMPSPLYAGHTILTHLHDYAFIRFEMGYASAIAVVLFCMMVGLNRFIFKWLGNKE